MSCSPSRRASLLLRLLCGGLLCAGIAGSTIRGSAHTDDPLPEGKGEKKKEADKPAAEATLPDKPVLVLDLPPARKLALEKQPALAAARASLAAAHAKVTALDCLGRLANLARPELPIRKQQAALAVLIVEARIRQVEIETLYSVTRLYWTAVYAQDQLRQVDQALDGEVIQGKNLRKVAETLAKDRRARREGKWVLDHADTVIKSVEGRREEARFAVLRALAGLREAIGLDEPCLLACADQQLPEMPTTVDCRQIVSLAAQHRNEIAQARWLVEVFALEIQAQEMTCAARLETFAAGADLHSNPLPAANFGEEYRPGAVGVEMPTLLAGPRCGRVEQAVALYQRAEAVLAKVQGLVRLEAENSFLLWLEARTRRPLTEEAARLARQTTRGSLADILEIDSRTTSPEVIDTLTRQILLRQQANQVRFQYVVQSAALERVTGGSFCPEYVKPAQEKETEPKVQ